jgi:hypothetical protein
VATKTVVTLVDDLTGEGGDDVESLSFGIDGATYEIDLAADNAAKLRDALATYIAHARRTGGRRRTGNNRPGRNATVTSIASPPATTPRNDRAENQKIREWANARGLQVAARGRIPGEVRERYRTEQKRQAAGVA